MNTHLMVSLKKKKILWMFGLIPGSSHTGCMKERGYPYPVDLYFEGSDQYRGWFQFIFNYSVPQLMAKHHIKQCYHMDLF